ncbi:MAG: hypothetical protein EU518_01420 [Promethearchaeota archaeon]|nr:MAG: hypothetical protein EU518_01420 [Candidatus Lokiarchaeota archaeon]
MIRKEDINRSLEFFKNLELESNEINLIFEKFKKILRDKEISSLIKNNDSIKDIEEDDDIKDTLNKILPNLKLRDLNIILNKIIEDESLTNFIQDLFLERLL